MNPHYNQHPQQQQPHHHHHQQQPPPPPPPPVSLPPPPHPPPPQPYYNNYQQHVPGPPQPPWQAPPPQPPATGWHDPRFQNNAQAPPQPSHFGPPAQYPPPTPPLQAPSASPDVSQWGVKYNQAQHYQYRPDSGQSLQVNQKPALPPRPNSSLAHNVPQQQPPLSGYQQAPAQYQPQGSWTIPQNHALDANVPPPRPAMAAQYGMGGAPQEQYSHHAPTHHYDPMSQHSGPHQAQSSWQQPQNNRPVSQSPTMWSQSQASSEGGPVSPLDDPRRRSSIARRPVPHFVDHEPPSQDVQLPPPASRTSLTSSAASQFASSAVLGGFGGGPSDWQHYDPPSAVPQDDDDLELQTPVEQSYTGRVTTSPLKADAVMRQNSVERTRPPSKASVSQPAAQPSRSNPVADGVQRAKFGGAASSQNVPSARQVPQREDSRRSEVSSVSSVNAGHNNSIDNVIQAWSAPMTVDSGVQTSSPPTANMPLFVEDWPVPAKVETHDHAAQTDFPPVIQTKVETRVETKEIEVDPYADLQQEFKATLKRFAGMLRQEAAAENDEDKFKIFQGFVIHELRLRSVLYGVEAQPQSVTPTNEAKKVQDSKSSTQPTVVVSSVDLPDRQHETGTRSKPPALNVSPPSTLRTRDGPPSPIAEHGNDDSEYSPGGRPRMGGLRVNTSRPAGSVLSSVSALSSEQPVPQMPKVEESGQISPGANAPMTLDDYVTPAPPSPSLNAPMVVHLDDGVSSPTKDPLSGSLNFQPQRPAYQPFRYDGGPNGSAASPSVREPPIENFAVHRQNQAVGAGRALVSDASPAATPVGPNRGHSQTPSGGRQEHEEAFIGLIRAKSIAMRKNLMNTPRPDSPAILRAGTPSNRPTPTPTPAPVSVPPLVRSVQSLRALIPKNIPSARGPKTSRNAKLESIVGALQKLPNDFTFIHARVVTWAQSNRQRRAQQDADRQARQSQSEERIDQLFNDNEIGYAEISELEKDFRLEEAGKKYREDQAEVESFTKEVFDFVTTKLEGEIEELTKLRVTGIDMLDLESACAAKQVQASASQPSNTSSSPSPVPLVNIMEVLLDVHERLEARYLKIAEAKFECERRRKQLESSVLYTNNDKGGLKRLEADFAQAEKMQILDESRKKADRANRLLDGFDRAVVRGLAENQGLLDDILTRLQLLRDLVLSTDENGPSGAARSELLYGSDGVRELLDRTSAVTDVILGDSKTLVQLLDKADNLSNDADFALYMAEARLANASVERVEKLKSEKAAEDAKVAEELTSRMGGIARVPQEILGSVREVRDRIGGDAGHEERINKALEAAKKRNTTPASNPT